MADTSDSPRQIIILKKAQDFTSEAVKKAYKMGNDPNVTYSEFLDWQREQYRTLREYLKQWIQEKENV